MCIITHSHLANLGHHVQPILSTRPFSALDDGDFYDPISLRLCNCRDQDIGMVDGFGEEAAQDEGEQAFYLADRSQDEEQEDEDEDEREEEEEEEEEQTNNRPCNIHDCCTRFDNFSLCPWYLATLAEILPIYRSRVPSRKVFYRNAHVLWESLEYACPNRMIINQYVHHMAQQQQQQQLPSSDPDDLVPLPVFPSVELFYNPRLAMDAHPEQCGRIRDAYEEVSRVGHMLWCARVELSALALETDGFLLDAKLAVEAGELWPITGPRIIREGLKHLVTLQLGERDVRARYCEFLEAMRLALALVGRLPEPGVPFVTGDGRLSISEEQLHECDLSEDEQEKLWNGPLLQSLSFRERFSKLTV